MVARYITLQHVVPGFLDSEGPFLILQPSTNHSQVNLLSSAHAYTMFRLALQVAAAVFSFRGTRLNKAGNWQADLHLMKDLNAEMMVTQRASKKIQSHMRRLQEQHQSVKWSFYTTGTSMCAPKSIHGMNKHCLQHAPALGIQCSEPNSSWSVATTVSCSLQHQVQSTRYNQLFDEVCFSGVCLHVADMCSQPGSQACTDAAGHSLGGFTAASCAILNRSICQCTAFEAPGLTTFYHTLAAQRGGSEYWEDKITNYFTIPNPINMCQKHLGKMHRVYTRTELRTDFLHVFKCLFGSCVRTLNWLLLANVLITAIRLLMGGMTAFTACAEALATQRSWATLKVRSILGIFAHSASNLVTGGCKAHCTITCQTFCLVLHANVIGLNPIDTPFIAQVSTVGKQDVFTILNTQCIAVHSAPGWPA